MNRREFLKTAGAAVALPTIIPATALGKNGAVAPSNRIAIATVGINWMGNTHLSSFLNNSGCQYVAVCDVDRRHLQKAKEQVDNHYGTKGCRAYTDFREMFARGDLDAVTVATPDHWHALVAVAAAQAGLDVYGEKPLSHNLREGRAMVEAMKRHGRIWQTGSWQRSKDNFRRACELVRNGRAGKIHTIEVVLGGGRHDWSKTSDKTATEPVPPELDWDMWLGPAPWAEYCPARLHINWRHHTDYGGGILTDWIGHHGDIANWAMGYDNTGPVEVEGTGVIEPGFYNSVTSYNVTCKYADGVTMKLSSEGRNGAKFIGDKGWVFVSRGDLEAGPKSILDEVIGPEEVRLYKSDDHYQNFLDCVRSRRETITPCETGHRAASIGHVCLIGAMLGRKLRWDPAKEEFKGDDEANRMLGRPMRSPWQL